MLVKRYCVAEGSNDGVRGCERKPFGDKSNRIHGIPGMICSTISFLKTWRGNSPDANEFNRDIDGEGLFEGIGLFPSEFIGASEHLVCKGDLLMVASGEEAHLKVFLVLGLDQ